MLLSRLFLFFSAMLLIFLLNWPVSYFLLSMLLFHYFLRLLSKTLLTIFVRELLVEQFNVDTVVLDVFLPIVLFDVECEVVVELFKIHSLDVRSCCRCCRR